MLLPNDDKRFLDLLQKWQAGDFTRGDEQELHALARGDDFRREALEGFLMHPEEDHQARLRALRDRLQPAGAVRRVLFPQITGVAAALVLLLAALWFFRSPAPDPLDAIAQNELPAAENQTLSDAAGPAPAESAPERSKTVPTISAPKSALPPITGPIARSEPERKMAAESNDFVTAPAPEIQSASSPVVENEVAKPDSDIASKEEKAVEQEQRQFDDVKSAAKKATTTDKMPRELPGQQAPANSMQDADFEIIALQDYLRRNARLPEAARQNNISGFVQVSFRLSKRREATDFKVLRSLGYGCDEAAVSLLKAYDWRDFSKDNLTVDVPFVR